MAKSSFVTASGVCSLDSLASVSASFACVRMRPVAWACSFAVSNSVCFSVNSVFALERVTSAFLTSVFAFSIRSVGDSTLISIVSNFDGSSI